MSSTISSSDTMHGCGLLHAIIRALKLRNIKRLSPCKALRRQPHPSSGLPKKQASLAASSFRKSSQGLVQGPFVAHQKLSVTQNKTHMKNGMEMIENKKNVTTEGNMQNMHHINKVHKSLVRATSGNVMIYGHLGNLGLGGIRGQNVCSAHVMDFLPKTAKEAVRSNYSATLTDNNNASFGINTLTVAAMVTSGQILEAVHEWRKALQINPRCKEANLLIANLYIRLGEADKAMYHYKHSGTAVDSNELEKAKALQKHLVKCTEAKRRQDWISIIKETDSAVRSGATSSPQIFSLQAEAYLKLRKHEDADIALSKATQFDADACKKFYGPVGTANLLKVKAQVDMAAGRFDDALDAARKAEQLDPKSGEVNMIVKKAFAIAHARVKGNELFKYSKFSEAYEVYSEGLDYDPHNSVLLCNRAACLLKLDQYERAVKDCTAALSLRPSYNKARLRKAECNAKMANWDAAISDYKLLLQKSPEDEDVRKLLLRAEFQLNKQ